MQRVGETLVPDEGVSAIDQSDDIVGIDLEGLVEDGEGLVEPAEYPKKNSAAIDLNVDPIRRHRQRRIIACQRLGKFAELHQHDATRIERVNVHRILCQDLVARDQGLLERAQFRERIGAVMERAEMVRIDRKRRVEILQRFGMPLEPEQRQPDIVERIGAPRLEQERRRIARTGILTNRCLSARCKALPRL